MSTTRSTTVVTRDPPPAARALTRRHALLAGSAALVGLGGVPTGALARALAAPAPGDAPVAPSTTGLTSLHQELELSASRRRIYDLLLDAKEFSAATGDKAEVEPTAGHAFALFGGRITGRNVELVPPERIVQAWRSRSWGPGVYSMVRFTLIERSGKTHLVLDHTGFPEGDGENLASGWREHYWEPLAKFLG